MPTYLYQCEIHKEFEIDHPISTKIELCPKCQEENLEPKKIKRLISGSTNFILEGGGWAKDKYS